MALITVQLSLSDQLYFLIALSIMGLAVLVLLFICTLSVIKLFCMDSSKWIDKTYRNLTMLTMLLFTLCSIGDFCKTSIRYFYGIHSLDVDTTKEEPLIFVDDLFYYAGNISFYLLLFFRIRGAFGGLDKAKSAAICTLIGIAFVASVVYCAMIIVLLRNQNESNWRYFGYVLIVLSGNDFILNCTLFVIFFQNLRNSIDREMSRTMMSAQYEKQVNLITNVMTKHCVLFSIALMANQAFLFWSIYAIFLGKHGVRTNEVDPYLVRGVENSINVCVLWLVLRVNYAQYICLCKCCHVCVARCCMRNKTNMSENPYHELRSL